MATLAELPSIRVSPSSSRRSTPKNRKSQLPKEEPPKPLELWEQVGMTKEEFDAYQQKVQALLEDWRRERLQRSVEDWWDSVSDMQRRLDELELIRGRYCRLAAWSAEIMKAVEDIDAETFFLENRLDEVMSEMDRLEYEWD
jgi:predicted RNase H-like nuclease (RuvC/YqgF family)